MAGRQQSAPVAFVDGSGRALECLDGPDGVVVCVNGVISACSLFYFISRADKQIIRLPLGHFLATRSTGSTTQLVPVADENEAAAFVLESRGSALTIRLDGTDNYVYAAPAGTVLVQPYATDFTLVSSLPLGSIRAAWCLEAGEGKKVSLWGGTARGWVTAHPSSFFDSGKVTSRASKWNQWEQFTVRVVDRDGGRIALKSDHGMWLSATPQGVLNADKQKVEMWETFELLQVTPGTVALRAAHHRPLIHVSAAAERVHCAAHEVGNAEQFILFDADAVRKLYYNSNPAEGVQVRA